MIGTSVQRREKFLPNFYHDNMEGEGVKECEECLSKTTLNVFKQNHIKCFQLPSASK